MTANEFQPGGHDSAIDYDSAVAVLEQLAAGVTSDVQPLVDAFSEFSADETDSSSLKPVPVGDVTQNWSKSAFHSLIESLPDAIVVVDRSGLIRLVNAQTESMFGYQRDEMCGWPIELLVPQRFRADHVAQRDGYFDNPRVRPMGVNLDLYGRRKNGSEFPVEISLSPIETDNDTLVASTIRDISQKKQAEAQLQSAEARYRTLVEEIPAVTFMASLEGGMQELYVSPQIEQLLGFSQKEWLENPILWFTQLHPDDQERWHKEFARTCATGKHFLSEYRFVARNGDVVWVHGEAKMVRDEAGRPLFLQGVAFDITDRKNAEETLKRANEQLEQLVAERTRELAASLKEKDDLLQEIHHRVKNNLQQVASILRLQSRALTDAQVTEMFKEMGNRLKSIAEIHELLYQSVDLSRVDFRRYVSQLGSHLRKLSPEVRMTIDIQDVFFGLRTAVPCGLIINELISNCLKYAFPEEPGEIVVSLRPQERRFVLTVRDNGVGLPDDFDINSTKSLGIHIVRTQIRQLKGELTITRNPGAMFQIVFAEKEERGVK